MAVRLTTSLNIIVTAVLKGFRMEAHEASLIVDKLVSLDLDYATSAGDIANALSRVAAVAQNANMSLDETSAILTVLMDVTQQESGAVGTALQAILSRYGNIKPGAFAEMAEEGEDASASLNDIEKVLAPLGIKIRSSSLEMRNFSDVMDELAGKWNTLDDVTRN